ncbi:hypothetical protein Tco_1254292 [Tanacetum coccineum]
MEGEDEFHDDNTPSPSPPTTSIHLHNKPLTTLVNYKTTYLKKDTKEQLMVLPPKNADEILAKEREEKQETNLLMRSLPEEHLAIVLQNWTELVKKCGKLSSRFGGNDEYKKMQNYILKQHLKALSVSNSERIEQSLTGLSVSESLYDYMVEVFVTPPNWVRKTGIGYQAECTSLDQ